MPNPKSRDRLAVAARESATRSRGPFLDIGQVLDDGLWTFVQRVVVFLAALAILMDGFDVQLVGFALPVLIKEWGVARGELAPALAVGLVGMGCGAACGGLVADRFGRRPALIGSVLVYGIATCLIGFSTNLLIFSALRFVAGLGIGGALPSATTMTAEFIPARSRTLAVTATIVCVPLGGMLAGVFAGYVMPGFGWRGLFTIGGLPPIVLALILRLVLPESPRFLAHHRRRWPELIKLLGRMSRLVPPDTAFLDSREQVFSERAGVRTLFAPGCARDTIAIWCVFLMSLLAIYSVFSWLPTMLTTEGLDVTAAGAGLTAYNLGGVFGAMLCAVAITRFGSRWPMVVFSAGSAASAFLLRGVNILGHKDLLIFGLAMHGLFANAVQSTIYAVCAYVYPTNVRATGTASGMTVGRIGAILSSFTGAAIITMGGAAAYFTMLGSVMICVLIALMAIKRHIPPLPRRPAIPDATVADL
jgi:AAHS family 4-hydroxybenzoate transporter-like MFS transporter